MSINLTKYKMYKLYIILSIVWNRNKFIVDLWN